MFRPSIDEKTLKNIFSIDEKTHKIFTIIFTTNF